MPVVWLVQHIVEELIFLVPQGDTLIGYVVQRMSDIEEMLEKLGGDILVHDILTSEFQSYLHHIQAVHAHPGCAIRLFQVSTGWQHGAAIKDSYIIQSQEPALEDIVAFTVLAVDPPVEVK